MVKSKVATICRLSPFHGPLKRGAQRGAQRGALRLFWRALIFLAARLCTSSQAEMSRFAACPVCGINVALHLFAMHTDAHFTAAELESLAASEGVGSAAERASRSDLFPRAERPGKTRMLTSVCSSAWPGNRAVPSPAHSRPRSLSHPDDTIQENCDPEKRPKSTSVGGHGHVTDDSAPGSTNRGGGVVVSDWSFLKNPSAKDVRGPRRSRKALDLPPRPFDYLVVLDFEWTCDNKVKGFGPLEIIEFPSVLVSCAYPPKAVSQFQVYCRPVVNPTLSKFCTSLTAITQEMVASSCPLSIHALARFRSTCPPRLKRKRDARRRSIKACSCKRHLSPTRHGSSNTASSRLERFAGGPPLQHRCKAHCVMLPR